MSTNPPFPDDRDDADIGHDDDVVADSDIVNDSDRDVVVHADDDVIIGPADDDPDVIVDRDTTVRDDTVTSEPVADTSMNRDVQREPRDVYVERETYPPPAYGTPDRGDYDPVDTVDRHAKTSAAAVFALVFGLSALFCALALILSPLAILFGIIGLILGIVGMKKGALPDVTGRGVAISGLVLSVLGLLLGIIIVAGAATFLSNSENMDRIEQRLEDLRSDFPTEIPTDLTN